MASSCRTCGQARAPLALLAALAFALCWSAATAIAHVQPFIVHTGAYQPMAQSSAVITFYMHDNLDSGSNPSSAITVVPSRGSVNGVQNNELFGAIAVFDDTLTLTADPSSPELGRGRGFYVFNALEASGTSLEFVWTAELVPEFVWTAEFGPHSGYAGSTISFKGYDLIGDANREIAVTGGTVAFRMAQGWATLNTAAANGGDAILLFTVHVFYGA